MKIPLGGLKGSEFNFTYEKEGNAQTITMKH